MLDWLFRRKRAKLPRSAEECFYLGTSLAGKGDYAAAIVALQRAVELNPGLAEAHFNLGSAYRDSGRLDPALACYRRAAELRPAWADAHLAIGMILMEIGLILRELGPLDEAIESLSKALAAGGDPAEIHHQLGHTRTARGDWEKALFHFGRAYSIRPDFAQARWAAAMAQIPAVYETGTDPQERRQAFATELERLEKWFASDRPDGFRAVAVHQPFYLAYQELPNRDLLARYGKLCARLMGHWQDEAGLSPRPAAARAGPVRLGIVSAHIQDHSVWEALVHGWMKEFDRDRFDLHVFHLAAARGAETRFARSQASSFHDGRRSFEDWARLVHASELDALIYPEIGMDATTAKLASMRLAPVQAASWGHPETTGLPTIDYFLSAEDLEPEQAEAHYTEKLVLLPHLGCRLERQPVTPDAGAVAQLEWMGPLLVCPGTPFKYAPQFDRVLIEIARRVPDCRLVFFSGGPLFAKLEQRLRQAFARAKVDFGRHAAFLPWMSRARFHGVLQHADLYLDTIGFSGFNSAMQAVECGLPMVAREGRFMRGRFAAAILRRIGLAELVTPSEDAYIELAVALAGDGERRRHLRSLIEARRDRLFEDPAPVDALQDFLARVAAA